MAKARLVFAVICFVSTAAMVCGCQEPVSTGAPVIVDEGELAAMAEWPETPCVMIDQPYYESSRDLENASNVMAKGEILSIELVTEPNPSWLVQFRVERADFGQILPIAANPQDLFSQTGITVAFPRICGEAPYGNTFAVGNPFILLLSGPKVAINYPDAGLTGTWYSPIQTTQGVIPIINGAATPLPGADVTISLTRAAGLNAPWPAPAANEPFNAAPIETGWPADAQPQYRNANVGAAWSPDPGILWVFTIGGTGCPTFASAEALAQARGNDTGIRVVISRRPDSNPLPSVDCPSDLIYYTSTVRVPAGTDETLALAVTFVPNETYAVNPATVIVPPRPAQGQPGEAVWAEPNLSHQFLTEDYRITP